MSIGKAHRTIRRTFPFVIFLFTAPIGDVKLVILFVIFIYIFYKGEKCAKSVHPINGKKTYLLLMAHRMTSVPHIIGMSTTFLLFYLCLSALSNDVGGIGVRLVIAERTPMR